MGPKHLPHLPFEFSPGHRIRIQKFITEIKNKYRKRKIESLPALHEPPLASKHGSKKHKLEADKSDDSDSNIPSTTNEISRKINNWSKTNYAGNVRENEHYTINVSRNPMDSSKLSVSIHCHCGKAIALQQKANVSKPWQISNWTKHCQNCKHGRKSSAKQETLQSFFPPLVSETNQQRNVTVTSDSPSYSGSAHSQSDQAISTPSSSFPALSSTPQYFFLRLPICHFFPPWQASSSYQTYPTGQFRPDFPLADTYYSGSSSSPQCASFVSVKQCSEPASHSDNDSELMKSPPGTSQPASEPSHSYDNNSELVKSPPQTCQPSSEPSHSYNDNNSELVKSPSETSQPASEPSHSYNDNDRESPLPPYTGLTTTTKSAVSTNAQVFQ